MKKILPYWMRHPLRWIESLRYRCLPVTNLDDLSQNCFVCGYDHAFKTWWNSRHYCPKS